MPYGPGPRNVMDVYVPLPAAHGPSPTPTPFLPQGQGRQGGGEAGAGAGTGTGELRPVVFFVHGGVWASGEPWQYAPMAVRLAQQGLVVVVPTYTLYPEALAGGYWAPRCAPHGCRQGWERAKWPFACKERPVPRTRFWAVQVLHLYRYFQAQAPPALAVFCR